MRHTALLICFAFLTPVTAGEQAEPVLRSTANGVVGERGDAELVLKRE